MPNACLQSESYLKKENWSRDNPTDSTALLPILSYFSSTTGFRVFQWVIYLVKIKSVLPRELLSLLVNSKAGNVGTNNFKMSEVVLMWWCKSTKNGMVCFRQLFCLAFFLNFQSKLQLRKYSKESLCTKLCSTWCTEKKRGGNNLLES